MEGSKDFFMEKSESSNILKGIFDNHRDFSIF